MGFDMVGEAERVLAHESFGLVGIATLEGRDDVEVVLHAAPGAVVLAHGDGADRAHVEEQRVGDLAHQRAAAEADDRLVERHVGLRILVQMRRRVGVERVKQVAKLAQLGVAGALGGEPRGQALDGGPDHHHFEDLGLALAHHEHAAAGDGADQAFLLEIAQRFADRGAADAEFLAELALVEPDFAADGGRCPSP